MKAKPWLLGMILFGAMAWLMSACTPEYPKCENDEHCQSHGQYCVHGLCQQCRDNSHCGACQQCSAGRCTQIPGCCQTTSDCAAGQKCRDGQCGPQCLSKDECGQKEICQAGRCVPVACFNDGDCAAGQQCVNNDCVAIQKPECTLERIHFDFDDYSLTPEAQRILDANAQCIEEKGVTSLVIEGHCDERGTEDYNLALGERRARSAKEYLQRLGVGNIRTVSYGENRPLDPGHDEAAWSQNRRDEFVAQ